MAQSGTRSGICGWAAEEGKGYVMEGLSSDSAALGVIVNAAMLVGWIVYLNTSPVRQSSSSDTGNPLCCVNFVLHRNMRHYASLAPGLYRQVANTSCASAGNASSSPRARAGLSARCFVSPDIPSSDGIPRDPTHDAAFLERPPANGLKQSQSVRRRRGWAFR